MSPKERMLLAIMNKQPDMVPVAPDISNMIPCKLTGKPFWEIYFYENPPLWKAYLEALDYYKFDGWFIYGYIEPVYESKIEVERKILQKQKEFLEVENIFKTPEGSLREIQIYPYNNPPWHKEKIIKNLKEDFKKLKYFYPTYYTNYQSFNTKVFEKMREELGDKGVIGINIPTPGFHIWNDFMGIEKLIYSYYDFPEIFEELRQIDHNERIKMTEMVIKAKPDFILTVGSGAITLSSPSLFRKFGLPTLKEITKMAKENGILTMVHCCGKEKELVEMCYQETDLNCINPLEEPPAGNCNLKEIKEKYGDKISLMGNINTTFMLKEGIEKIEQACKKAIDDAGEKGGFILSTGDQLGRDTPDENIFKMIEVARNYGKY